MCPKFLALRSVFRSVRSAVLPQRSGRLPLFLALLALTSCSDRQFGAVMSGSSVGGMFGSSIGGLMGGPRGADKGTLAGMIIGGAIGAAVTAPRQTDEAAADERPRRTDEARAPRRDDVQYDSYRSPRFRSPQAAQSDLRALEVTNIHFLDENGNRRLDSGEQAYIVLDIYNGGRKTLYNVAPQIACNSRRVVVSPPAAIAAIRPGQGIRYKAAVRAVRRLKKAPLVFTVSFGTGEQQITVETFQIHS